MQANYTAQDIFGTLRAMVGFVAILFCPGYLAGAASNLFGFRGRGLFERVAWSIALSFGLSGIITRLLGRTAGLGAVEAVLWFAVAATVVWLVVDRKRLRLQGTRSSGLLLLFLVVATAVVLGELIDIQKGNGLLLSVTVFDQAYRVGFTEAIARTGIPPANPFYYPGAAAPLRYYYFWYALCALCMKLAHVSARQAFVASSVWSGVGLVAVIALFARHLLAIREGLHRYILAAALLLTVTGADLLPTLYNFFFRHQLEGDLEWWSGDQVSSWMDSVLWVPNHVSAVVASVTAFVLLWRTQETVSRRQKVLATVLAGVMAASAFGCSIYVAAGFALLMVAWCVRLLLRGWDWSQVGRVVGAAGITVALLIPYLREMIGEKSGTEAGTSTGPGHLLTLGVRQMIDPGLIADLRWLSHVKAAHPAVLLSGSRLLLLIPGYAFELGFYGAALILLFRARRRMDNARQTLLFLAGFGLAMVTFIRSAVIGNNDFGYRAAMLPMFFLLLLGAELTLTLRKEGMTRGDTKTFQGLRLLLLLGLMGTVFQAALLRWFVPIHTNAGTAGFVGLPETAFEIRRTYENLVDVLPADAIVQANPTNAVDYYFFVNMIFTRYQMVTDAGVECGAAFGGEPTGCHVRQEAFKRLFASPAPSAWDAVMTCRQTGAGYLAVSANDAAWRDKAGWVWTLPLARPPGRRDGMRGSGERFRIVSCRGDGLPGF